MLVPNALYMALGSTAHGDSFDQSFGFKAWPLSFSLDTVSAIITDYYHYKHDTPDASQKEDSNYCMDPKLKGQ